MEKWKFAAFFIISLGVLALVATAFAIILHQNSNKVAVEVESEYKYESVSESNSIIPSERIHIDAMVNTEEKVSIKGLFIDKKSTIPTFGSIEDDWLVLNPKKNHLGSYFIEFSNEKDAKVIVSIKVSTKVIDWDGLKKELTKYLGVNINDYSITVRELNKNTGISINGTSDFPPASMAKMTMAILVMRDIEAGKYTLDTTFPLDWRYRFSAPDDLSKLPDGSLVPMSMYLQQLIELSSNTAWYHLHEFLGRSYGDGGINDRTEQELGVKIFLDPHIGTSDDFAKLFAGLYHEEYLNKANSTYLIDLMKNAARWNKEGIGQSYIDDVEFANKIGTLWTDTEIAFEDTAIVYGKNIDYVISVMNRNTEWEIGKERLKKIGEIVHKYVDV